MRIGKYANKERVTAIRWTGNEADLPEAAAFAMKGIGVEGVEINMTGESLVVLVAPEPPNFHNRILVPPGHWLVMSSSGRISWRAPSVFNDIYEEIG